MRTEKEVRNKLKQVRYRYLKKAIRKALAEYPNNYEHAGEIKQQIEKQFDDFMRVSSPAEIAYRFPDMAALSWVLGIPISSFFFKEGKQESVEEDSDTEESERTKAEKASPVDAQEAVTLEIPEPSFLGNAHIDQIPAESFLVEVKQSFPVEVNTNDVNDPLQVIATEKTDPDTFWSRLVPNCFKSKKDTQ